MDYSFGFPSHSTTPSFFNINNILLPGCLTKRVRTVCCDSLLMFPVTDQTGTIIKHEILLPGCLTKRVRTVCCDSLLMFPVTDQTGTIIKHEVALQVFSQDVLVVGVGWGWGGEGGVECLVCRNYFLTFLIDILSWSREGAISVGKDNPFSFLLLPCETGLGTLAH